MKSFNADTVKLNGRRFVSHTILNVQGKRYIQMQEINLEAILDGRSNTVAVIEIPQQFTVWNRNSALGEYAYVDQDYLDQGDYHCLILINDGDEFMNLSGLNTELEINIQVNETRGVPMVPSPDLSAEELIDQL